MSPQRIALDGETLSLEQLREVALGRAQVELAPAAKERVVAARALVDRIAEGDTPSYGINTGFGTLAEVRIDKKPFERELNPRVEASAVPPAAREKFE